MANIFGGFEEPVEMNRISQDDSADQVENWDQHL
jgi:hypothetical protein